VTIEPEFSLDQPSQINHLVPDGVLAKDSQLVVLEERIVLEDDHRVGLDRIGDGWSADQERDQDEQSGDGSHRTPPNRWPFVPRLSAVSTVKRFAEFPDDIAT
jgi:hypothetical protein